MQSNFFIGGHLRNNFKAIIFTTFIVYFICAFCGWVNFLIASLFNKIYYPLRSYFILFDIKDVRNLDKIGQNLFNFSGYKAKIVTDIPYKLINDILLIIICFILAALFYLGYEAIKKNKIDNLDIMKWAIAISILMTISIPSNSADLYGYIARGAQQTLYHQNPYIQTVSEVKNYKQDPLFSNFMWPHQPTTYGPIFISMTKSVVFLSNNNFLTSFFNFKLLNLMIYALFLVFMINKVSSEDFFLISCNPLIFIQGLWNSHNDLICGILIFAGIYLFIKSENIFLATFVLAAAIGVKYVPVLIFPVLLIHLLKNKKDKLLDFIIGILCGFLLIALFSIDYINVFNVEINEKIIRSYRNVELVHKSLIATIFILVKYVNSSLNLGVDLKLFLSILKNTIYFLYILFYMNVIFFKKNKEFVDIVYFLLLIFFCFTIGKFHSWYLLNFIFLLVLINKKNFMFLFSVFLIMFHTFSISFIDQAKILNFAFLTLIPLILVCRNKFSKG